MSQSVTKYIVGADSFGPEDVASFIDAGMIIAAVDIGANPHKFLLDTPKQALTETPDLRPNPRVFAVTITEVQQTH